MAAARLQTAALRLQTAVVRLFFAGFEGVQAVFFTFSIFFLPLLKMGHKPLALRLRFTRILLAKLLCSPGPILRGRLFTERDGYLVPYLPSLLQRLSHKGRECLIEEKLEPFPFRVTYALGPGNAANGGIV